MGDPGGPLVAVCAGRRCSALLRRHGTDRLERLRRSVRGTAGALLVSTGCLERCHLASAVLLGWRSGQVPERPLRPPLTLAGMDGASRLDDLARWVEASAPPTARAWDLPASVVEAAREAVDVTAAAYLRADGDPSAH